MRLWSIEMISVCKCENMNLHGTWDVGISYFVYKIDTVCKKY